MPDKKHGVFFFPAKSFERHLHAWTYSPLKRPTAPLSLLSVQTVSAKIQTENKIYMNG